MTCTWSIALCFHTVIFKCLYIWTLYINITESSDMELSNPGTGIGYHHRVRHKVKSICLVR
jgi:hypothetical protein